jgi:soluble P-type ATPase
MILIQRPGRDFIEIEYIIIDFEGTLAKDRRVNPKAKDKINLLSKRTKIYIFTHSEKEIVLKTLKNTKAEILFIAEGKASEEKINFLREIGPEHTVVIGNGQNDVQMIREAALSICVIGREGAFTEALTHSNLVMTDIIDALDFLLKPLRQKATLGQ